VRVSRVVAFLLLVVLPSLPVVGCAPTALRPTPRVTQETPARELVITTSAPFSQPAGLDSNGRRATKDASPDLELAMRRVGSGVLESTVTVTNRGPGPLDIMAVAFVADGIGVGRPRARFNGPIAIVAPGGSHIETFSVSPVWNAANPSVGAVVRLGRDSNEWPLTVPLDEVPVSR
jgi:hypothetical protein